MAKRRSARSLAARRGWETRRANAARLAAARSAAARKAAATRRANIERARELHARRSDAARRAWDTRRANERERERDRRRFGITVADLEQLDGPELLQRFGELVQQAEDDDQPIEEMEIESSEPATYGGDDE